MARTRRTVNEHIPSVPRSTGFKDRTRRTEKGTGVAEGPSAQTTTATVECSDVHESSDLSRNKTAAIVVHKLPWKANEDPKLGRPRPNAPNTIRTGLNRGRATGATDCKPTSPLGDEQTTEMPSATAHPGYRPTKRGVGTSNSRRAILRDAGKEVANDGRKEKNMSPNKRRAGRKTDEETINLVTSEGVRTPSEKQRRLDTNSNAPPTIHQTVMDQAHSRVNQRSNGPRNDARKIPCRRAKQNGRDSGTEQADGTKVAEGPSRKSRGTDIGPPSAEESVSIPTDVRRSARLALKFLAKSSRSSDLVHTKGSGSGRVRKRTTRRRYAGRRQTAAEHKQIETNAPIDLDLVDFIKLRDVDTPAVSEDRYTLTSQWKAGSSETLQTNGLPSRGAETL